LTNEVRPRPRRVGRMDGAAWFMGHRIREAMRDPNPTPLGGEGKIVEADEAYHGKKEAPTPSPHRQGRPYIKKGKAAAKRPIFPLVGEEFATHETVNHSAKEYARGDVTTNTVEGFFGAFKRGMNGIYQHCGEQPFQRYLDEFTFRYNNRSKLGTGDTDRAVLAIRGAERKRLTYEGRAAP